MRLMRQMCLAARRDEHGGDVVQFFDNHAPGVVVVAGVVDGEAAAMAVGEAYRSDETEAWAPFWRRRSACLSQHERHSLKRLRARRQLHPSGGQAIEK